jgi:membrane fusion protein, heavy metal efflux system
MRCRVILETTRRQLAAATLLAMGSAGVIAQPLGCLIEPDRVAEVGSPVIGVIEVMLVERGDRVRKGQPIARLRSVVERAVLEVAARKAEAEADAKGAEANLEFARQRERRAQGLYAQKFISAQALDQARAEASIAEQRLAQAREQQRVSARELELAQAQLAQRNIQSPFDGVIVERYAAAGERVEEKPLYKVASINPLRIEVVVPAAWYGKVSRGAEVRITPELPDAQTVSARVVLVDRVIDAASNTFRVRATLPNAGDKLPAGLRCKADLGIAAPGAAAAERDKGKVNGNGSGAESLPAGGKRLPQPAARAVP